MPPRLLHGGVVLGALAGGARALAVAWTALVLFPPVNSVRHLLEHRAGDADPATDYRVVDHGYVNRLFCSGPLASTLGGCRFRPTPAASVGPRGVVRDARRSRGAPLLGTGAGGRGSERAVEYHTSDDELAYRRCEACRVLFLRRCRSTIAQIYPPAYYADGGSLVEKVKAVLDRRVFRLPLATVHEGPKRRGPALLWPLPSWLRCAG